MDKTRAQFVLESYRAGTGDEADPIFIQALHTAGNSPELAAWLDQEQARDHALRARLREVPVPADLCDSILAGVEPADEPAPRRRTALLALAASIVLLLAVASLWVARSRTTTDFRHFRQEMVSRLDSRLVLSFTSERPAELQQWLAENRGLAGSIIPAGLQQRPSIGCRSWTWNGKPAGLICFLTEGGQAVHLFIVSRDAASGAPAAMRELGQVGQWQTVSWAEGDLAYVLAGKLDSSALEKLL